MGTPLDVVIVIGSVLLIVLGIIFLTMLLSPDNIDLTEKGHKKKFPFTDNIFFKVLASLVISMIMIGLIILTMLSLTKLGVVVTSKAVAIIMIISLFILVATIVIEKCLANAKLKKGTVNQELVESKKPLSFYKYYSIYPNSPAPYIVVITYLLCTSIRHYRPTSFLLKTNNIFAILANDFVQLAIAFIMLGGLIWVFWYFGIFNHITNNKKIIDYLKNNFIKGSDSDQENISKSTNCIQKIINRYGANTVKADSYDIPYKNRNITIGAFTFFDEYRGWHFICYKGLFAKINVPQSLGNVVISNTQISSLEEKANLYTTNRFIPKYNNIPLVMNYSGNADSILNERMQFIISEFASCNKNIGIIFKDNTIFISLYCKYIFKYEKKNKYYESMQEAITQLIEVLNNILSELSM